jgi:dTDP-4-dehydrorhamnose 3,5-epimerase-like enzyme
MKKIILAALILMSASVSAQVVTAGQKTETVNVSFSSTHDLRGNEVQVAASTVCLNGKLFAVAVQKDSTGKTSGGVALTQIMESNATGHMFHVDCRSNKK